MRSPRRTRLGITPRPRPTGDPRNRKVKFMRPVLVLASILALAACKRPEPPATPRQAPGLPAQAAGSSAGVVRGKVLEKVEAPPYSYLKLATANGEAWAAVP